MYQKALVQAQLAYQADEVPVGALLVHEGRLISSGYNQVITLSDPTAHAEIQALRAAGLAFQNYRLPGCTLYVTVEPCVMCAGALVHARVARVVFGCYEPKTGATCSVHELLDHRANNHTISWTPGVLEEQCAERLVCYFKEKRKERVLC
ncbi:MAG: tRNA adenosine(34) deaminase TadA [Pseudomonadota bacterium]